jgi:manganese/zinc/iron transport system ATP- binding protein
MSAPVPAAWPGGSGPAEGLRIRDLAVAYQGRVVLEHVSADIRRGQVVGVVGPNGGGKSTLLMAILGIVPIVRGDVTLFGQPAALARHRIAYVPQREAVDWDFPVSVREVVLMGRYPHLHWPRRPRRHDAQIVGALLDRLRMTDLQHVQIGQLSGGQQQRVFLARALAQEADVLLLDEPMNGVDNSTQEVILELIEEQRRAGRIVLLATHDLASASCTCDCLCCVNERMVAYGPTPETYTEANLAATYGGAVIWLGRPGAPAPSIRPHPAGATQIAHGHGRPGDPP